MSGSSSSEHVGVAAQQCFEDQPLLLATGQRADRSRRDVGEGRSHRGDGARIPQHLGVVAPDVAPVRPRVREPNTGLGRSRLVGGALGRDEAGVGVADLGRAHPEEQLADRRVVADGADELAHDPEAAVDRDRARRCALVARDHTDEGRLPDAVRADEGGVLGVADAEGHVVEELAPARGAIRKPVDLERAHERAYDDRSSRSRRRAFSRPTATFPTTRVKNSACAPGTVAPCALSCWWRSSPPRRRDRPAARPGAATTARRRPNVLFVLTDDLDRSELRFMPHTRQLIGDRGATFDNYFVSNSLCCPSRVTTLRGQYAHNTGVWSNSSSNGGFEQAFSEGIEQDTVATRLSGSGYRTALVGKYLNGYPNRVSPTYRPPGWTTFVSPSFGTPYGEYGYTLNDNGRLEFHGRRNRDYGTRVYVRRTQHFMRTAVHANMPFFAYLAVYAPHQPATPARATRRCSRTLVCRARPRTTRLTWTRCRVSCATFRGSVAASAPRSTILYRLRIRSLQAVDRGVARLVHTLRSSGQLDNTYIVFTSDNGFHLGQHRLPAGKQTAYDTDIHVPLLIRGPGITAGTHVTQLTGNVDLAPTFEAMAGVDRALVHRRTLVARSGRGHPACRAPLAQRLPRRAPRGRRDVRNVAPRRRSLPLEPPDPDQGGHDRRDPGLRARTSPRATRRTRARAPRFLLVPPPPPASLGLQRAGEAHVVGKIAVVLAQLVHHAGILGVVVGEVRGPDEAVVTGNTCPSAPGVRSPGSKLIQHCRLK